MSPPFPLREAHAHLIPLGRELSLPTLSDATSLDDALSRVRAAAARTKGWTVLTATRPSAWPEARWPTVDELIGAAGAGARVVLMSFDHHTACATPAAIEAAGLRPGERVGAHGLVEADASGTATGMLHEDAAYAVWQAAVGEPSDAEYTECLRAALRHLRDLGYGEVHDMHADARLGPALAALADAGELALQVSLYAPIADIEKEAARASAYEHDVVRLAGGKIFTDGTLSSRTAWMLRPYADVEDDGYTSPTGRAMMTPEEIDAAIATCNQLGLGIACHAIGDAAVRAVLDSAQRVGAPRWAVRVEHAELVDAADVPRFDELGVVCSPQPCHLLADAETLQRATPDRLDRVMPLRELIGAGLEPGRSLVFGSDAPIVRADAQDSVLAATARVPSGSQRLTQDEAWACFAIEGEPER